MFTKEELINFGIEKLADIILSVHEKISSIKNGNQLELIVASLVSDPEKMVAAAEKDIESLSYHRFFDAFESFAFADEIRQVNVHIEKNMLPKFPNQAVALMLNLLDDHQVILRNVDDKEHAVEDVFAEIYRDFLSAYENATISLDSTVDLVYDKFMDDNYFIYSEVIEDFKDIIGNNGLNLLKQKLEQSLNEENGRKIQSGLKTIANCQNDVDGYIAACTIIGKPDSQDHFEIAKRLITHGRGKEAIKWLDSVEFPSCDKTDVIVLKIQALDLCGDYNEAQAERQKWFETTLSHQVYQEILKHVKADCIQSFKTTAIQTALDFPDLYVALDFLKEIKEFERAGKLVCQKIDTLDGNNYHKLRPIAEILCKINPLAATLLYRKMIEPILTTVKIKYFYRAAAKNLAVCQILSSNVTDWKGYKNHQLYFKELSIQLKKKTDFWREYKSELSKQMVKDGKMCGFNKRKSANEDDSSPQPKKLTFNEFFKRIQKETLE